MVTKGIVSGPSGSGLGTFVVDAVAAPGSSGSIAFAIRDGIPNFELVGMIRLIPVQASFVLTPAAKEGEIEYDAGEPYHGEVFVERKTEIQYGIAQAISAETILDFIRKNLGPLARKGYYLDSLLEPRETEKKNS
jgi:hypothetical protein